MIAGRRGCPSSPTLPSPALPLVGTAAGFHDMFVWGVTFHDMFHDVLCVPQMFTIMFRNTSCLQTICFTICLFISPDLDGHRAPKNESFTPRDPDDMDETVRDMFHDMFVH